MENADYFIVSQLFDSIAVIEKGIDRIYHYLLVNKRIDNLKEVCEQFGLSLKRGYKVASVLNELELVQIYDRPMKIQLATPVVEIWQKIINTRIENLRSEFQEKINRCEESFEEFLKNYNLKEEVIPEPVEFISFSVTNFEEMYYPFMAKQDCKVAIGIAYENPLLSKLQKETFMTLADEQKLSFGVGMKKIQGNLKKVDLKVIINSEVISDVLNNDAYAVLKSHIGGFKWKFKSLDVRITEEFFSNFSIRDTELIQPSFDPTNILIGSYISRNRNIYQIFYEKFNELFEKGIPIANYLQNAKDLPYRSLTDEEIFAICMF